MPYCKTVKLPGGGYAFVRLHDPRPKKCQFCEAPSTLLCDYPDATRPTGTCDRPCCRAHAKRIGPDRDYCQDHAAIEGSERP